MKGKLSRPQTPPASQQDGTQRDTNVPTYTFPGRSLARLELQLASGGLLEAALWVSDLVLEKC